MPVNHLEGDSARIIEINKQILEIKKKIQLAEGQRKALFEECEAEKKANAEEIIRLKKEISELVVQLHENKSTTAKLKIQKKRVEFLIGPIDDKAADEVGKLLDLQVIDRNKQLDLIRYRIRKRQKYLADLAKEYQCLLSEKAKKQVAEKIDVPVRKATRELQNSIHAVEVQLREAVHISKKYTDIRRSLQEDAAKFESKIKALDEKLDSQRADIDRLQQVLQEATRMRSTARGILLKEERTALTSASARERQSADGRRLVTDKKHELEELEKRLFQGGKSSLRQEPEGAEDNAHLTDEEKPESPPNPIDVLSDVFETLKKATGGTNTQEVLARYIAQKDSHKRLMSLRQEAEEEKKKLEKHLDRMNANLERYKYAETKDTDRKAGNAERIKNEIAEQEKLSVKLIEKKKNKEGTIKSILGGLQQLYLSVNPLAVPENDAISILSKLKISLTDILQQFNAIREEKEEEPEVNAEDIIDEKWLPGPYNSLIRRTPVPQAGTPAPPPVIGTDDEDEVPSRGYLKRQAQLVVDAKARKKTIRIPRK